MKIVAVDDSQLVKAFLQVHIELNRQNPAFIIPIEQDVEAVFDPSKNKLFRQGKTKRWLLQQEDGRFAGRIAAFVNPKYRSKGDPGPIGGFGFFDCINQQDAANLLFDTARTWLTENGMLGMDGPINFGERDKFWGLLVEGFQSPPYGLNYNPPYYKQLFENYGFQVFYNQLCFRMEVAGNATQLQPKFYEAHKKFEAQPAIQARMIRKNQLDQAARDFCTIYNKAWAKHEGNKEMSDKQAIRLFHSMQPIMDETIAWITYHNNEPIAMWINIPDLNQIFRKFNGKLNWLNKLRLLYHLRTGTCNRFIGIIYGIVPEFQGTGIDYYMIVEAEKVIKKQGRYKELELMWQGDFNQKMINISHNLGATQSRKLITWRLLFDSQLPFKRHPFLN
ncbi:hypothetical protein [Flavihumibacter sp. CACIAM 22H1]|uniref:hypothetical protein n=1 Tax=Flavihumibacter sp. CACIAM 22H1 TaxID=1812911 RepID=UPI0007A868B9|nr:hypothetical protein [Flavihumibacter sp. CACIAM 22H1]KYP16547.1 MAG: hypothetical protein A1D16_13580 [Flavihumibacter sp. CACIAM 22H1]